MITLTDTSTATMNSLACVTCFAGSMILFLFIYYNYLLVLLNLGAKVRIFLYRCTTFYCSIPVIYTYLGIILEASMIFLSDVYRWFPTYEIRRKIINRLCISAVATPISKTMLSFSQTYKNLLKFY